MISITLLSTLSLKVINRSVSFSTSHILFFNFPSESVSFSKLRWKNISWIAVAKPLMIYVIMHLNSSISAPVSSTCRSSSLEVLIAVPNAAWLLLAASVIVFPPSHLLRNMFTRRASRERRPAASTPVFLNVYDLSPLNGYAYWLGLGVYHSGVQVHGVEYAYGAHEHAATGIFDGEPRRCPGVVFRKAILIGRTDMGPREVRALVEDMAAEYSGIAYNLISKNCNHFCDDACFRLTGKPIPKWVNRLAKIGFLCKCVLPARMAEVRKRGAGNEHGILHADIWRPRSNSARFPPAITATLRSNIWRRRLRRSASLSSAVGESSSSAA